MTVWTKISIRVLLGAIIGLMGAMLFWLGLVPMMDAMTRFHAARQLAAVTETSRDLFDTLQNLRLERGALNAALTAPGPISPQLKTEVPQHRGAVEAAFARTIAMTAQLDLAGLTPVVEQLQQTHQHLADLRAKADAAAEQPKTARDPAIVAAWPETGEALLTLLTAATDLVDASIRRRDAVIDNLLVVKREAWVAREFAGVESQTGSAAIASGKPWTTAQIQTYSEAVGRQATAWQAVTEVAGRADASPRLKAALAKANAGWFGQDRDARRPVFVALLAGQPSGVTMAAWMGAALPSLGSISQVPVAALADMMDEAQGGVTHAFREVVMASVTLVLATVLTLSGFLIVQVWVCNPIVVLTHVMRRLAERDYTAEVPPSRRDDELGAMAQTVSTFRENGLTMQRLELEAEAQRRASEAEQKRAVAARLATARQQEAVVGALAGALERLAQGDLTCQIDAEFAADYEQLRRDFNGAMAALGEVVCDITAHAATIGTGTHEIALASDDLARRTEQAAASLEQTAAALHEITATVNRTAENSQQARDVALAAQSDAERSGRVVQDAMAAMSAIEGSARQIGDIIGVIDEIAFQTNLLAINAGVEAAHAGEAGRGFAVVAAEVRALAQRSAAAARQIKALIATSSQQVTRGVALVGQTGAALGHIRAQMQAISQAISDIAACAQEQAAGLAEVNIAVGEMDHVTQQNAAMVEQTTSATHSLSNETDDLRRSTSRFRIAGAA
jgi:methyl-accepting chemotaxis protein